MILNDMNIVPGVDLKTASNRKDIKESLRNLLTSMDSLDIIPKSNYFSCDTANRVRRNFNINAENLQKSLIDYISFSVIGHCIDSWSYLRESIVAYINGQYEISMHLAYYSELRVLMSILASLGIGVFEDVHIVIDNKHPKKVTGAGRTHSFVNKAIMEIIETHPSFFLTLLPYESSNVYHELSENTLYKSLNSTLSKASGDTIKSLLQHFFDLTPHRTNRNRSSYSASYDITPIENCFNDLDFLQQLWTLCDPIDTKSETPKFSKDFYNYLQTTLDFSIKESVIKPNPNPSRSNQLSSLIQSNIEITDLFKKAILPSTDMKNTLTKALYLNILCNMNCIDMIDGNYSKKLNTFLTNKALQHNLVLLSEVDNPLDIWQYEYQELLRVTGSKSAKMSDESLLKHLIYEMLNDEETNYNQMFYHLLTNFEYTWAWGLMSDEIHGL